MTNKKTHTGYYVAREGRRFRQTNHDSEEAAIEEATRIVRSSGATHLTLQVVKYVSKVVAEVSVPVTITKL